MELGHPQDKICSPSDNHTYLRFPHRWMRESRLVPRGLKLGKGLGLRVVKRQNGLTFGTRDNWAALIFALLHGTFFANWLCERAHAQIAHQHTVMASTVQTGLIRHNPVTLRIVIVIIIAAGLCSDKKEMYCCS